MRLLWCCRDWLSEPRSLEHTRLGEESQKQKQQRRRLFARCLQSGGVPEQSFSFSLPPRHAVESLESLPLSKTEDLSTLSMTAVRCSCPFVHFVALLLLSSFLPLKCTERGASDDNGKLNEAAVRPMLSPLPSHQFSEPLSSVLPLCLFGWSERRRHRRPRRVPSVPSVRPPKRPSTGLFQESVPSR